MKSYLVDDKGFYGEYGGAYVPEILYATVENLRKQYLRYWKQRNFKRSMPHCSKTMWDAPHPYTMPRG